MKTDKQIDDKVLKLAKKLFPETNDINRHRALALVGQLLGWLKRSEKHCITCDNGTRNCYKHNKIA